MKKKHFRRYLGLSVAIFLFAGILHSVRLAKGWDLVLDGYLIPNYISALIVIITLGMIIIGFDYLRK